MIFIFLSNIIPIFIRFDLIFYYIYKSDIFLSLSLFVRSSTEWFCWMWKRELSPRWRLLHVRKEKRLLRKMQRWVKNFSIKLCNRWPILIYFLTIDDNCTGCMFKGQSYESGVEWTDPDDPCASFKCVAGVVTESSQQCYTPCNNPILPRPGQCCSTCLGKWWHHHHTSYIIHIARSLQKLEKKRFEVHLIEFALYFVPREAIILLYAHCK